jgi:hypothetical protein
VVAVVYLVTQALALLLRVEELVVTQIKMLSLELLTPVVAVAEQEILEQAVLVVVV